MQSVACGKCINTAGNKQYADTSQPLQQLFARDLACSAQSATSFPSNFRVGPLANHRISARNIGLILETLCPALPYLLDRTFHANAVAGCD
jgi:hypothetical protein